MSKLSQFLSSHRLAKGDPTNETHNSLNRSRYYISEDDRPEFMHLYATNQTYERPESTYLVEVHTDVAPVLIDLDFRQKGTPARVFTRAYVELFVGRYVAILREYVAYDSFDVYVLLKGTEAREGGGKDKEGNTIYKDGIHIIIPGVITRPGVQYAVRDAFIERHPDMFNALELSNNIKDIFDDSVIHQNGWLMYGSNKPEEKNCWVVRHRFRVSSDAPLRLIKEIPPASELVHLFSIRGPHIKADDTKLTEKGKKEANRNPKVVVAAVTKKVKASKRGPDAAPKTTSGPAVESRFKPDVPLDLLRRTVMALSCEYYDPYETWRNVAWGILHTGRLHGYYEGSVALCHEFSKQSARYEPAKVDEFISKVKTDVENPVTFRSLLNLYLAKDCKCEEVKGPIRQEAVTRDRLALLLNAVVADPNLAASAIVLLPHIAALAPQHTDIVMAAADALKADREIVETAPPQKTEKEVRDAIAALIDRLPEDDQIAITSVHFTAEEVHTTMQMRELLVESVRTVSPELAFEGWSDKDGGIAAFGPGDHNASLDDNRLILLDGSVIGSLGTARAAHMASTILTRGLVTPKERDEIMMALANTTFPEDRLIPPVVKAWLQERVWRRAKERDSRTAYTLLTLEELLTPRETTRYRFRFSRLEPRPPPPSLHDPTVRWDEVLPDTAIRPYDPTHPFQVVRAGMGMGKTKAAIELVDSLPPDASVLIITYSIALSNKMRAEFVKHGFTCYLDNNDPKLSDSRLIVCLDSITRVNDNVFDLVILDESLSLLQHLHSPLMKRRSLVCAKLSNILVKSARLLLMDAAADNLLVRRFVEQLHKARAWQHGPQTLSPRWVLYTHVSKHAGETCRIVVSRHGITSNGRVAFLNRLIDEVEEALEAGMRVVISCSSLAMVKALEERLGKKYPSVFYSSETDPAKLRSHIKDVNAAWILYRLVVYSPTITAGISFEVPDYFDIRFAFFENSIRTAPVDVCVQQLFRVRSVKTHRTVIYVSLPTQYSLPCLAWQVEHDLDQHDMHLQNLNLKYTGAARAFKDGRAYFVRDNIFYAVLVGTVINRHMSLNHFLDILIGTLKEDRGMEPVVSEFTHEASDPAPKRPKKDKAPGVTCFDIPTEERYEELVQRGMSVTLTPEERQLLHNYDIVVCLYRVSPEKVDRGFITNFVGEAPPPKQTRHWAKDMFEQFSAFSIVLMDDRPHEIAQRILAYVGYNVSGNGSHLLDFAGAARGGKHHRAVILIEGLRLLTTLAGSSPIADVFTPDNNYITKIGNERITKIMDSYLNEIAKAGPGTFQSFRKYFGLDRRQYASIDTITDRTKRSLAKKVLGDAFNIDCNADGEFTASASQFLNLMTTYEPQNLHMPTTATVVEYAGKEEM